MVATFCKRARAKYENERETLFLSDKKDVAIYKYDDKYYVELDCRFGASEFYYYTLKELLDDAIKRDFFGPMELTENDCDRLYEVRQLC